MKMNKLIDYKIPNKYNLGKQSTFLKEGDKVKINTDWSFYNLPYGKIMTISKLFKDGYATLVGGLDVKVSTLGLIKVDN